MKPLTAGDIRKFLSGRLIQGSENLIVQHGAYRIKQVKNSHTILFCRRRIIRLDRLKNYFPLVLVTDYDLPPFDSFQACTILRVKNIEEAYWKFVRDYRRLFTIPVVAVTGTSGKTTTKEMIKHILSTEMNVTATNSTNNSRTAHLHYLLSIDDDTEAAVFETAVGAPGDVLKATEYFKPTIGVITNIGEHHLNYCKTLEAYIKAKGEIVSGVHPTGVLILNGEDEKTRLLDLSNFKGRIIRVGKGPSCQLKAKHIQYEKRGMSFILEHENKSFPVYVPGWGEHQVYNALAALAAVHEIGCHLPESIERLKTYKPFNKQLQLHRGINDCVLIDDTWSLTTTSLEAALKVLRDVGKEKKKIAVIGTITDLGSWGIIIHEQAGELISKSGIDVLITIGQDAKIMANTVMKSGAKIEVHSFNNSILVYPLLQKIADQYTMILVKGDMYSQPVIDLARKLRKNHVKKS